jgi:predicted phosphodiesterase
MTKSQVAKEYRLKFGDKKPTLALARIMYKENSLLFKDVEDARGRLRYIEGKIGVGQRKGVKNSEFFKEEHRPKNPYNLPVSDEIEYKPYILKGHDKVVILNDIHIPYHSVEAITATFDYLKKEKPDAILLNGDTLDFYGLSRFIKDPRKRNFAGELSIFKEMVDVIKKKFPYAKIYFKVGNHEERYFHYLWMKAGELVGVEEFELENILKARANGIEIIQDKRIIKANELNIIHGHEFGTSVFSPVNIARGLYLKGKVNAIQGHNHSSSEHTEKNMNDKITTTWSVGCLCELHPQYLPINKWNHGFAIVYLDSNKKDFEVINKRIYRGKVL